MPEMGYIKQQTHTGSYGRLCRLCSLPLAWLRAFSEQGWATLPSAGAAKFLEALSQGSNNTLLLLLQTVRRSTKSTDGVTVVTSAAVGDGIGEIMNALA